MSPDYQGVRRVKCNPIFALFKPLLSELCIVITNQTMKRLFLLIIFAAYAALLFSNEMSAISKTSCQEVSPIIITPGPSSPGGNPRSPETSPFSAYRTADEIVLSCDIDCGTVDIELYSTAGDAISTLFDTSEESTTIPISGNAGDYSITITDQQRQIYIGLFSIL
jgi:hypothetical protein